MKLIFGLIISFTAFSFVTCGQPTATKNVFPAAMETFQIPSHGVGLNALMYIAGAWGRIRS